ncbi:MAG TPA: hypothetical protein V6D25_20225 [Leptolyngbyaceae cyanobacterium]
MLNEIVTIYSVIDDLLKAIGHDEDSRIRNERCRNYHNGNNRSYVLWW